MYASSCWHCDAHVSCDASSCWHCDASSCMNCMARCKLLLPPYELSPSRSSIGAGGLCSHIHKHALCNTDTSTRWLIGLGCLTVHTQQLLMSSCISIHFAGVRCSGMWGGVARQLTPPASHVCVIRVCSHPFLHGSVLVVRMARALVIAVVRRPTILWFKQPMYAVKRLTELSCMCLDTVP